MSQKPASNNTVAPLYNVGLFMELLEYAKNRNPNLPGMVCFAGPSGFGKSSAASYAYMQGAYYIQCRSVMTRKTFLEAILKELGVPAEKTIGAMFQQIVGVLSYSRLPLIIDEMDHMIEKSAVEIIRDIHEECSNYPIALIGEESMPSKLKRWERFQGRILKTEQAMPVSLDDCLHLARLYCPGVTIGAKLNAKLHTLSKGSARRVCVNLSNIAEDCKKRGINTIDIETLGKLELYTGITPPARSF